MSIKIDREIVTKIYRGADHGAWLIYEQLFHDLKDRGLLSIARTKPASLMRIQKEMNIPEKIHGRLKVALDGLCKAGILEETDGAYLVVNDSPKWPSVDIAAVDYALSPAFRSLYLTPFKNRQIFDEDFGLEFNEQSYALWNELLNAPGNKIWRDLSVDWCTSRNATVADLAFGTVRSIEQAEKAVGPYGKVIGVESSDVFVENAKKHFQRQERVKIIKQDINDHFETGEKIDSALLVGALHFVDDPDSLIKNISSLCKPDSRIALSMFFNDRNCFSGPAFHMHRNLFMPPAKSHSIEHITSCLLEEAYEVRLKADFGGYTSIYCERIG